jgi:type VI protein secretion system component VasK
MSTAEAIGAILGAAVPLLVALASLLWWAYKRGEAAGEAKAERRAGERSLAEDKAKIQALERQLAEILAELAFMQPKRRRALGPAACRQVLRAGAGPS